jgi:hypothetical protein
MSRPLLRLLRPHYLSVSLPPFQALFIEKRQGMVACTVLLYRDNSLKVALAS